MFFIYDSANPNAIVETANTKEEAFEKAKNEAKNMGGSYSIYDAKLIAIAELSQEVIIKKVKKQKIVPQETFNAVIKAKEFARNMKNNGVPLNARCEFDGNLAVTATKNEEGKIIYLCLDCSGT